MGSGTTIIAAEELKRRWIGIDNSKVAVESAKKRLLSLYELNSFKIINNQQEI
jgi:DNA modification methylase